MDLVQKLLHRRVLCSPIGLRIDYRRPNDVKHVNQRTRAVLGELNNIDDEAVIIDGNDCADRVGDENREVWQVNAELGQLNRNINRRPQHH